MLKKILENKKKGPFKKLFSAVSKTAQEELDNSISSIEKDVENNRKSSQNKEPDPFA